MKFLLGPRRGRTQRFGFFLLDSVIWSLAVGFATALRFESDLSQAPREGIFLILVLSLLLNAIYGVLARRYAGRYVVGSFDDARSLVFTSFLTVASVAATVQILGSLFSAPRSVILIAGPIFLLGAATARALFRTREKLRFRRKGDLKRAIVYGAGSVAEALIPQLLVPENSPYLPVVVLDDDSSKFGRKIAGVPVKGNWQDFPRLARSSKAAVVLVAIVSADSALVSRVVAESKALGLDVVVLPTLKEFLAGANPVASLRSVTIEDLVGRKSIHLRTEVARDYLEAQKVLVTGAGGSIGSELVGQLCGYDLGEIVLLDRDETALQSVRHMAERLSSAAGRQVKVTSVLADLRDSEAIKGLFAVYSPGVVFHAGALKHVPILEQFPREAWKTNVLGTLNVLEAAHDCGTQVFVNVSTDKAANPTNVLGRSKLLGERLTAWFANECGRQFFSVRFGNVLGSRGSLIPLLAGMIEQGGPVTVTDPRATRYFMSVYEAAALVVQSVAYSEGGDVIILDMGEAVSIDDVARKLIALSGKDGIGVVYTGLRPGEKLHEVLVSDSEVLLPSGHKSLHRVKSELLPPALLEELTW